MTFIRFCHSIDANDTYVVVEPAAKHITYQICDALAVSRDPWRSLYIAC